MDVREGANQMTTVVQPNHTPGPLVQLTAEEFALFRDLIYDKTAICVGDQKRTLVSNRLRRRLRVLGLKRFREYYDLLADPALMEEEIPHFLSVVTTNETYFFRQERFWRLVLERLLDDIAARRSAAGHKSMRFWSGASSSGEEAYTLSIVISEYLKGKPGWDIHILGTDISQRVLEKARRAEYDAYAVSKMRPEQVKRYFTQTGDGRVYRLCDSIRNMADFRFHNLKDPMPDGRFDLVILRNVMMYFDRPAKRLILENVTEATVPGGYVFVGEIDPTKDAKDLRDGMNLEYVEPSLYRRSA